MEREKTTVAKNGIKIYSYTNPALHSFYISLFVKAGCMYESASENGITHFLEHAVYRNVNYEMGGELYSLLDRYGVEFGASTYSEMIQFYTSGVTASFKLAADIISKVLSPIRLPRSEVEAEKSRIKAEIRESDDRTSLSTFSATIVHEGTSLSRTILGTLGSVSQINASRLEKYRRRVFSPENIFVYVTGAPTDEDLDYLKRLLGEAELFSGEIHDNVAPVSDKFNKREKNLYVKNADFTMLRFSFDMDMSRIAPCTDDVLYEMLLGGYSSRFFIEMSEKRGLFYDIAGSVEKYKNIGSFAFNFEVRGGSLYEAVEITLKILSDLKKREPTEQECVKTRFTDSAYLLYDDARELNFNFAYDCHIMGAEYKSVDESVALYNSVTPKDVHSAACEIFKAENLTLAIKCDKKRLDAARLEAIIEKFKDGVL
ncbi:MAG: insulinase family protein [Clostridia bacterium]|nr:insulinase family protein [Clostridia bacterium]